MKEPRCCNHKVLKVLDQVPQKKQVQEKILDGHHVCRMKEAEARRLKFEIRCEVNGCEKTAEILVRV